MNNFEDNFIDAFEEAEETYNIDSCVIKHFEIESKKNKNKNKKKKVNKIGDKDE